MDRARLVDNPMDPNDIQFGHYLMATWTIAWRLVRGTFLMSPSILLPPPGQLHRIQSRMMTTMLTNSANVGPSLGRTSFWMRIHTMCGYRRTLSSVREWLVVHHSILGPLWPYLSQRLTSLCRRSLSPWPWPVKLCDTPHSQLRQSGVPPRRSLHRSTTTSAHTVLKAHSAFGLDCYR